MSRAAVLRLLFLALVAGALGLALAACGGDDDDDGDDDGGSGKTRVVATVAPVAALAREVGGDLIELHTLVGPGVDPHDYELKSDDRKRLDGADVVLRNGLGLDDFLSDAIDDDKAVTVTEGIEPRHAGHDAGEEDGHDHGDEDPHAWHNPQFAARMVDNIAAALAEADSANAEQYRANAAAYRATLEAADREIRALIDGIPEANRKMVTNHDAFGYFIEYYGLEFVGAVIPSLTTSAEPSVKDIAELTDLIESEGVKAIFAESSIDPKVAEQIAQDTGVKIVDDLYGDSLGEPGSGADTVHGMLLANARTIAEALQ
ncbi:MAG: zinc ABC transporter substrate-binding protein [Dehalococcoidia bacterium]|nr:zinc ABC transporter substrate-binding protein [Dehalococcoidia bacterium]